MIEVSGQELLNHSSPIHINPALTLEQLPNRDSLAYVSTYGLEDATTMYRGTLRYKGFSSLMHSMLKIGFLSTSAALPSTSPKSWLELTAQVVNAKQATRASVEQAIAEKLKASNKDQGKLYSLSLSLFFFLSLSLSIYIYFSLFSLSLPPLYMPYN